MGHANMETSIKQIIISFMIFVVSVAVVAVIIITIILALLLYV